MDWDDEDEVVGSGSPEEGEAGREDEVKGVFNVPGMAMGQVFQGDSIVTSMDFHEDGELCVAANSDKSITLINAVEGRKRKTIHTQKYGCGVIRYTHHDQTVLVSSDAEGVDHAVRYLSLYDNQFLRFFTGHTDNVVSIAMSPTDDHFMTGSADKTVRLWHLSRPQCLAVLEFPAGYGTPYVAYDQQGLVFAAATSTGKANIIKLYDARNYEKGPFDTFTVEHKKVEEFITKTKDMRSKKARALSQARWKSMKFSADGQSILISTDANLVLALHAFEGDVKQAWQISTTAGVHFFRMLLCVVAVLGCGVSTPGRVDVMCCGYAAFGGVGGSDRDGQADTEVRLLRFSLYTARWAQYAKNAVFVVFPNSAGTNKHGAPFPPPHTVAHAPLSSQQSLRRVSLAPPQINKPTNNHGNTGVHRTPERPALGARCVLHAECRVRAVGLRGQRDLRLAGRRRQVGQGLERTLFVGGAGDVQPQVRGHCERVHQHGAVDRRGVGGGALDAGRIL